jgi:hypothetical protein
LGSHKRQLRSHALVFINDTPAALELPREVTPEEYMVVFAKLSDSELQVGRKKRLLVRRHVTDRLLSHYRKNLDDYREIPTNHSYFDDGQTERILHSNSSIEGPDSDVIRDTDEATNRPGRVQRLNDVEISTSAGFRTSARPEIPAFRVNRSNNLMPHQYRKYELLAFPHLHSNGLGNVYDDDRTVHVPAPEARRHLLGLSIRTLATDPLWLLVNFDNSNKSSAQGLLTVRLSRDQGLANAAFQVTPDELQALAQHQDDSRRAALSGAPIPRAPRLLDNVRRVMSHLKRANIDEAFTKQTIQNRSRQRSPAFCVYIYRHSPIDEALMH